MRVVVTTMLEWLPLILFVCICLTLMAGYPVALTLAGVSLLVALAGWAFDVFPIDLLGTLPLRVYGIMTNETLIAVPLFVLMGVVLEKSNLAERMLVNLSQLFGRVRGGIGLAVLLVGTLLAASTGIVGATVIAMGLLSLPVMLRSGYSAQLSTGLISATGTLGQIIPPSIALILLGDVISNAHQQAQLSQGIFAPDTVSVGDLFVAAVVPGLLLVLCYGLYLMGRVWLGESAAQAEQESTNADAAPGWREIAFSTLPAIVLILVVLGSIFAGIATPTEASGLGACGALALALLQRRLSLSKLNEVVLSTARTTSMVFLILIGASVFSLVFRGLGGDELVAHLFDRLGSPLLAMLVVMLLVFVLGFILDFIEITFMVVPIVAPILIAMGYDPLWLGIMLAINLQTSFLTPPFGFALFYLRGVAPATVATRDMYTGVAPFIAIQLLLLVMLWVFPQLVITR